MFFARANILFVDFFYFVKKSLERYAVLEDGNLLIAVNLVACLFAAGNRENFVNEFRNELLHSFSTIYELAGIEVNPVLLTVVEVRVGGNLHCRNEGAERSATTC